jgi:hypothetical protein
MPLAGRAEPAELLRKDLIEGETDMSDHDAKQAYAKPELVEYGQMRRLTLQSSNQNSDNSADGGE